MWFSAFFTTIVQIPDGLTHPTSIRKWVEGEAAIAIDDELIFAADPILKSTPKPRNRIVTDERTSERLAKLAMRSAGGGEGADIAQKALEAYARKYDCPLDDLIEAAKAGAPETFFQFGPAQPSRRAHHLNAPPEFCRKFP